MEEFVDVLSLITTNCPISDSLSLSYTCKCFNKAITKEWSNKKLHPYTLRPYQYMFASQLNDIFKTNHKCIISASLGSGKTVTAIYFIMNFYKHKNILIVSPPSVLKVWIAELIKVELLKTQAEESTVIVCHSVRPKHQEYHKAQENIYMTHRIVLTTDNIVSKVKGTPDLIIKDESHKPTKKDIGNWYDNNSKVKILGLTAEDVEPSNYYRVLKLIDKNLNDKIPEIEYRFHVVNSDKIGSYSKYGVHVNDVINNSDDYRTLLINCIKTKQKEVIFLDKGGIGTEVRNWIAESLGDYQNFELLSSNKTVESFNKCQKKSILFIGANNNEGLNIFEENMILLKPDIMAATRIKQSIGRLRRPGNPYKTVYCDIIVGDRIALLKSFYAVCYSDQTWTFGFEDSPNPDFLLKCGGIMSLFGYPDFIEFPRSDACIIFDNVHGISRFNEVSKWWLENKKDSILSIEQIKSLYV